MLFISAASSRRSFVRFAHFAAALRIIYSDTGFEVTAGRPIANPRHNVENFYN